MATYRYKIRYDYILDSRDIKKITKNRLIEFESEKLYKNPADVLNEYRKSNWTIRTCGEYYIQDKNGDIRITVCGFPTPEYYTNVKMTVEKAKK